MKRQTKLNHKMEQFWYCFSNFIWHNSTNAINDFCQFKAKNHREAQKQEFSWGGGEGGEIDS